MKLSVMFLAVLIGLGAGCGEVTVMDEAAADGAVAGAGGSDARVTTMAVAEAGGDVGTAGAAGGAGGAGGASGTAGASVPSCTAPLPTVEACHVSGTVLVTAQFWCTETYDAAKTLNADNCVNGIMTGYYAGMSCPFDVAIATAPYWTGPAPEHTGAIITNGGTSVSTIWRNTADTVYCCDADGLTVKKLDRCP